MAREFLTPIVSDGKDPVQIRRALQRINERLELFRDFLTFNPATGNIEIQNVTKITTGQIVVGSTSATGDYTSTSGDITLTNGDLTLTSGDLLVGGNTSVNVTDWTGTGTTDDGVMSKASGNPAAISVLQGSAIADIAISNVTTFGEVDTEFDKVEAKINAIIAELEATRVIST